MGWGAIPDDHRLMAGMAGLQTAHQYGNATMLASDFVLGIGNRWANRHTGGLDTYRRGRTFVHVDIEPTQIGRVFAPDYGIVSDAGAALALFVEVAKERRGSCADRSAWVDECVKRKQTMLRRTHFDDVPVKPQRVYEEMNRAFGRDTRYVSTDRAVQIAGGQFLHVFKPRHWINAGQAGPLGWTLPAALGVCVADPDATVVALSGDYDFQFMLEELAVGAQFHLPYVHVVGEQLLPRADPPVQRGFDMDYCVQLSFDNVNTPELGAYGVDHVKVAEGLGCKAVRVDRPEELASAFEQARKLISEFRVPVLVEVLLERVTNISMGTELDNVVEFEELATLDEHAPTADRPTGLDRAGREETRPCTSSSRPTSSRARSPRGRSPTGSRPGSPRVRPGVEVVRCPSPTAATAPSTPRSRPATSGSRCAPTGRPASRSTPPSPCARASRWSRWPTSRACGCCRRTARAAHRDLLRHRRGRPGRAGPGCHTSCSASAAARARTAARDAAGARACGCSTRPGDRCPAAARAGRPRPRRPDRPAPGRGRTRIVVACDVDNPLLGPHGAAAVYGPQKGASPDDVARSTPRSRRGPTSSTAASAGGPAVPEPRGRRRGGGVGLRRDGRARARARAGDRAGPRPRPVRRPPARRDAGDHRRGVARRADAHGKAPAGVAAAAEGRRPGGAVSGPARLSPDRLRAPGIAAAYALTDIEPDVQRCLADAGPLLERLATNLARERIGGTTP
jgi:hypothetical protein